MPKTAVKVIQKVTWIGSIANISLAFIKITIGKMTGSQALIADGVHSFSDLVTDTAILIGSRYWTAPADKEHPYGHGRFETLTNIFIGILLALVGIGIGWESLTSISEQSHSHPGMLAFAAAVTSIVVKEVLYRWTAVKAKEINSRALYANAWHHRSDALSSLPVAIAVIANYFVPELHYLDQIAALIVTAMILKAAAEILWPAVLEITEAKADAEIENKIQAYAAEERDIKEVHAIRSRRTGSTILLDFHLLVDPEMSVDKAHTIAENFKMHLLEVLDEVVDIIIHIEPFNCQERILNPCCDSCDDNN
ncbi:cation transporter [Photobacterium sp. GB-27]|uniref:cation diffusion facilitator family transporter n=1 Tax=unclassified Photobacterium TaxID=2628852 RepID=UPI000D1726AD|nr:MULTISPECIES: cation diffusion facilitator family transporter [unclassified Photobacterium]PSV27825.1 cation transporter [Photobacterium sp. GB-56]PSV32033.1 cation transporter [Photobacterium sp. GB-72]PSV32761.1 cation transporter [Photobacterium sp. GB-27]PSV38471.1 cation transporter [Photobacterium sp. GB-210]PSV41411.1 cation transporter [Photobacterium sp. GB-36]